MPSHVALLRGVNVGGHNILPMARLRAAVAGIGHLEVATYLQSGNVVLTPAGPTEVDPLADDLERVIRQCCQVTCSVVVLTCEQLRDAERRNPFPQESNPKALHAVFRRRGPGPDDVARLTHAAAGATAKGSLDQLAVVDQVVYLHTPGGLGRSELAAQLSRAHLHDPGTARNWATVTALLGLLHG